MSDQTSPNPYACHPRDTLNVPFAGRQHTMARLRQHVTDPTRTTAFLVLGRRQVGKTSFLRAFDQAFDDNFVGVYLPLRELLPMPETEWWLALAQTMTEQLVNRAFTLHRLSELEPPGADARAWFAHTFLPPVLTLVRPHRHVVLLMDDAEALLDAIRAGGLAADSMAFLHQLQRQQPRFHLVLTLDTLFEDRLDAFDTLIRVNEIARLSNLAPTETIWLLTEPVAGSYTLDDMALMAAQRLTGGEPAFVQALGCALYRSYEALGLPTRFTAEDVKQLASPLFQKLEGDLGQAYARLAAGEQQTLRAISQLHYADPLRPVAVSAVTGWLADSEEPLDGAAVGAALRSLEYREIVTLTPDGIRLTSELMQRWLLEHAYDVPLGVPPRTPAEAPNAGALMKRTRGTRLVLLAVLVVMLIVGLLLLSTLSSLPRESFLLPPAEPTVTLPGGS